VVDGLRGCPTSADALDIFITHGVAILQQIGH